MLDSYQTLEENIILKNLKMKDNDSRNKIYASRKEKITTLIDLIEAAANATYSVRNDYANSVNVDTHHIGKMIEY